MNNGQPPVFHSLNEVTAGIVAFFVQFLPLLLIPFAFKMAGGITGRVSELLKGHASKATSMVQGNDHDPDSMKNVAKRNARGGRVRRQATLTRTGIGMAKNGNRRRAWVGDKLARTASMGNVLAKEAQLNKEASDRIGVTKGNGDDSFINAAMAVQQADGSLTTLDGKQVTKTEARLGNKYYGTMGDKQAISTYRETKDLSPADVEQYIGNYGKYADQQGWTSDEMGGQWLGTAFARQDERGELKHGQWKKNATGQFQFTPAGGAGSFAVQKRDSKGALAPLEEKKADAFVTETYYKKGSVRGANMLATHPEALHNVKKEMIQRVNGKVGTKITTPNGEVEITNDIQKNAEARLRQVLEIEDAYSQSTINPDAGDTSSPTFGQQYISRMAGANPGTIAAFNSLVAEGAADPKIATMKADIAKNADRSYNAINKSSREAAAAAQAAAAASGTPYSKPYIP